MLAIGLKVVCQWADGEVGCRDRYDKNYFLFVAYRLVAERLRIAWR